MSDFLNPYVKTIWVPHIVEVDENNNAVIGPDGKPVVITQGTRFTSKRANNIEEGIYELFNQLIEQKRINQRQDVRLALMDRSSSNNIFFDPLDGNEPIKLTLDTARADVINETITGTNVLNVSNTTGFKPFTEVTIYDDVNYEDVLITAVDPEAKTITVQALVNGYKKGAQICRSNVVIDSEKQEMKIGNWGTYSVAVSEVV